MNISLNKSDWYIIGIFFFIAIPVTFSGYDYETELAEAFWDTVVYVVFTIIVTYLIVFILFPRFFPDQKIFQLFLLTAIVLAGFGVIEIWLYHLIDSGASGIGFIKKHVLKNPEVWLWGVSTSAQNAGIAIGILLGKKFYDAQLSIQEKDNAMKENELRLLKSQIDPHFLFNNLNTVDSLIDRNPGVAKKYLQKLSQLYRYLIRTKDDEVVMLEDEIEFAENYIYLLNQRFGNAFQFEWKYLSNAKKGLIPPGALQTLLENVVKHNAATSDNKINTELELSENEIVVANNVQKKGGSTKSTKTGLNNLKARYALLSNKEVLIEETSTSFVVHLPIIKEVE